MTMAQLDVLVTQGAPSSDGAPVSPARGSAADLLDLKARYG